ncbi:MAG TPA: hypothetical protein VI911_11865 [Patescibacteria group bacterium]|nr:hypothetical protein [Patescibacteria group bacterium]
MESVKHSLVKQKQLMEIELCGDKIHCSDYYKKLSVVHKVVTWTIKVIDSMILDIYKDSSLEQ